MKVHTEYKTLDAEAWRIFVEEHPHGSVFQLPAMVRVYEKTATDIPLVVAISDKEGIAAMLVAVVQREHQGVVGVFSARSVIMGAPLMRTEDPELLENLLKAYHKALGGKAIYSQFRNHWEWSPELKKVFTNQGYVYENHLDILHDLTLPIEMQLAGMHSGRRKNIRRAEKLDLEVQLIESDADLREAYQLVKATYRRIRLPLAEESFFRHVKDEFGEKLKVFAVKHNGIMIGTRMVFCFNGTIYDWYAGSAENHHDKYPNDYLPWLVMKWGSENGYRTFDFGGAGNAHKDYGVRDYKLKFGGKLVEFGRFQKVHKPLLMQMGILGLKLYKKIKR